MKLPYETFKRLLLRSRELGRLAWGPLQIQSWDEMLPILSNVLSTEMTKEEIDNELLYQQVHGNYGACQKKLRSCRNGYLRRIAKEFMEGTFAFRYASKHKQGGYFTDDREDQNVVAEKAKLTKIGITYINMANEMGLPHHEVKLMIEDNSADTSEEGEDEDDEGEDEELDEIIGALVRALRRTIRRQRE